MITEQKAFCSSYKQPYETEVIYKAQDIPYSVKSVKMKEKGEISDVPVVDHRLTGGPNSLTAWFPFNPLPGNTVPRR